MPGYVSKFSKEYLDFRDSLTNAQLLNFRAQLKNFLTDGEIRENTLTIFEVGGSVKFHIYIDRVNHTVWILGGHWVRIGEPSKGFIERMSFYEAEIAKGREPE